MKADRHYSIRIKNKMKLRNFLVLPLVGVFMTGCASIISDSQYPVAMTSNPSGASFEIRNEQGSVIHRGTTPGTVTLKAGDGYFSGANYTIVFKKDGYADQINTLSPTVDGWYVANILFGGLIGLLIVDPATGAMYKLPESSSAVLSETRAQSSASPSMTVVDISSLTEEQRAELERIM
ncbi:MAG: hypothetical protein ACK4VV_14795 [Pseudomonas sp.]